MLLHFNPLLEEHPSQGWGSYSGDCLDCSHDGDADYLPAGKLLNATDGDVAQGGMKLSCWCQAAGKRGAISGN